MKINSIGKMVNWYNSQLTKLSTGKFTDWEIVNMAK